VAGMMITDPTTAGTLGTYQPLVRSAVDNSQAPMAVAAMASKMKSSL
jgi:hypothetical protein